jgi:hypothetical protein
MAIFVAIVCRVVSESIDSHQAGQADRPSIEHLDVRIKVMT